MSLSNQHWAEREAALSNAEKRGEEHARRDQTPNYRGPAEYGLDRRAHDAWLRGYSRIASIRWAECVRVY